MGRPSYDELLAQQELNNMKKPTAEDAHINAYQEERTTTFLSQIRPENTIKFIEMYLKGYELTYDGRWIRRGGLQFELPPELISKVVFTLSGYLNTSGMMANLTEKQVNDMTYLLIETIIDDMSDNAEAYGLEERYAERSLIVTIVVQNVFSALTRSLRGMEARRLYGSVNLYEGMQLGGQKKGNFLSKLAEANPFT